MVLHTPSALEDSVFRLGVTNWTQIIGTLNGTVNDRIQAVNVLDELIFSNNGADPIQKVFLSRYFCKLR
jgi:hypothetical protein